MIRHRSFPQSQLPFTFCLILLPSKVPPSPNIDLIPGLKKFWETEDVE
ncbi:rCG22286 [Rattus norvegicus]|uniref:RCG22286 n=1 Tax=Rattus norvegicus TaxID=10116 RepID=A6INQ5_RAT|nr:rCG22286 [Rattus norvegicus]